MWDSLWINVSLATCAKGAGYGLVADGALGIAGGKIAWLGARTALPRPPEQMARTVHDGRGFLLTPGFIDCHTHLVHAGNRAREFEMRLQGKSYAEIAKEGGGILATVVATRAATEDALFRESLPRLQHMIRGGATTVEIKSGYGLDLESERRMLRAATQLGTATGIRVRRTFLGAHALAPEFSGQADAYIDHICDVMLPALAAEGLVDAVDAFCETIAFTPQQTARVFECARRLGLPVKLHADQLSDLKGAGLAARFGALSADHLEYTQDDEIAAMAKAGTVAVLLPAAFYFLGETRKPPVALFRRHGVPIALATDCNPGSAPVTSLRLVMNMACALFGLTPEEALTGVTRHAAMALGLGGETGSLETGKAADLALWPVRHPAELCYEIGSLPAAAIVAGGAEPMTFTP